MGFDLDFGPEFTPDRIFQPARNLMCRGERLLTIDFEIDRY